MLRAQLVAQHMVGDGAFINNNTTKKIKRGKPFEWKGGGYEQKNECSLWAGGDEPSEQPNSYISSSQKHLIIFALHIYTQKIT